MDGGLRNLVRRVVLRLAGVALALAAAAPASASQPDEAAGGGAPHGRILGVIRTAPGPAEGTRSAARATDDPLPLTYHGGPVMHSSRTHLIFWAPPPFAFRAGYTNAIAAYLQGVAADSGRRTNVYAVGEQYTDVSGNAAYASTYGGSQTITDALPAQDDACAGYAYTGVSRCVSDTQIRQKIDTVINTTPGWDRGLGNLYFLVTPAGIGSCYALGHCSYTHATGFCGYHSWFGAGAGLTLYANHPYAAIPKDSANPAATADPCTSENEPTGAVDDTLSIISHEHNEAITDPTGGGWFDSDSEENGDKCSWVFGTAGHPQLGGTPGTSFNQLIAGTQYELQLEWDNASLSCLPRLAAAISASAASTQPGAAVTFDAIGATTSSGADVDTYAWSFGDGTRATGGHVAHAFSTNGTYTVTLTSAGTDGVADTTTSTVVVRSIAAAPVNAAPPAAATPPAVTPPAVTPPPVTPPPAAPATARLSLALLGRPLARTVTWRAISRGIALRARCSRACALTGELRLSVARARRLGLERRIAWTSVPAAAGTRRIVLRLTRRAAGRLRHAPPTALALVLTARAGSGPAVTTTRRATLRG